MRKLILLFMSLFMMTIVLHAQVLDIPILDEYDDVEEKGDGSMDPQSSDLELIYENTDYHNGTGLRFQNVDIPKGAVITKAYIQFTVDEDGEDGDITLYIKAEDADNSAIFTNDNFSVSSRNWSTDSIAWNPPSWSGNVGSSGEDQRTSDISSLVQGVIDRDGWISGNPITLNIVGPKDVASNRIAEAGPDDGPTLHIEYTVSEPVLVGYWNFDEITAEQKVIDQTDNGLDGTLGDIGNGDGKLPDPETVAGYKDNAVSFTLDYMAIDANEKLALNTFTVSAWIKIPEAPTSWGAIFAYAPWTDDNIIFQVKKDMSGLYAQVRGKEFGANTPLELNTWYFVTLTIDDKGVASLYLNGDVDGQLTDVRPISGVVTKPASFASIYSGGDIGNTCEAIVIDEAKIFAGAMTEEQVKEEYDNLASGSMAGLVVKYDFEDFETAAGSTVADISGNANDGVVHGTHINKINFEGGSAIEFNPEALDLGASSDPNNNCVVLPEDAVFASQEFTISAWIKASNDTLVFDAEWGEWGAIFAHDIGGAADYGLFYDPYGSTMGVWSEGMGNAYLGGGEINVGEWNHVALTMNAADSILTLYVNGIDVSNKKVSALLPANALADTTCIGGSIEKSKPFFGAINDLQFYNTALSAKDIAELARIMEPDLYVDYDFEDFETDAGSAVADNSGYANDGVVHGTHINKIDFEGGSAIEFNPEALDLGASSDPNNNCVVLPENAVFASQEFTISAWINPSSDTLVFDPEWGEWGAIFAHDIGGTADYGLFYDPYGSTMGVWSEGMGNAYLGGGEINVGEWNHVALTVDAETKIMTLYVNGVDVANKEVSNLLPAGALIDTTCIGGSIEKSKPFFGAINDFQFRNFALSAEEIAELARVMEPGLYVKYDFEDFDVAAGSTVADISGNANDGVVNGPHINKINGIHGSAIEFNPEALDLGASSDPNNNCVVLPENAIFASQEFTISAWINPSNDTLVFDPEWGEWGAIFAHDIGGAADYGLFYDPYGSTMGVWSEGMGNAYLGGGEINVGVWNHVALTVVAETKTMTLYVNGEDVANKVVSNLLPAGALVDTTCIGGSIEKSKPFFGAIDDFQFYNKALTANEIKEIASSTGLVVEYDFNNFDVAEGSVITDITGNSLDGAVSGIHINKIDVEGGSAIEFNPEALDLTASSDPNNNCVILPEDAVFASQTFTIAAWINASNDTLVFDPEWGEWGAIFAHDIGGAADYGLFYDPYGSTMGVWSEGMGNAYLGGGEINVGEWNHVALTMNAADSILTLYVNGTEVSQKQVSKLLPANALADTTCIGGSIEKSKPFFGAIDNFQFYNKSLSAEKIRELAGLGGIYKLTAEASGGGSIALDPESEDGKYNKGTEVTITATADDGYIFSGWTGIDSENNPVSIVVNADITVKANFKKDITEQPKAKLIAHWSFDEGEGTSVADDVGGYDGVLFPGSDGGVEPDPEWVDGVNGSAVSFTRDFMKVEANTAFALNSFSFSSWVKVTKPHTEWGAIFAYAANTDDYIQFGFNKGSGALYFYSTRGLEFGASTPLELDKWYFVTVTADDAGKVSIYLDGELDGESSGLTPISDTNIEEPISLAARMDNGWEGNVCEGITIDDASLYGGVLSQDEIKKIISKDNMSRFLVSYWTFDEGSGLVVEDTVGGIDGTLTAATEWVDGVKGSALNFNSSAGYLAMPDTLAYSNYNFTVSMYVKWPDGIPSGWGQYIEYHRGSWDDQWWGLFSNHNDNGPYLRSSGLDVNVDIDPSKWYNVVITYDETGRYEIYIDGTLVAEENGREVKRPADNAGALWIGGNDSGEHSNAYIDEVKYYNTVLTPSQIMMNHLNTDLVAHWKFDETSGTVAHDVSGNDIDLNLVNTTDDNWVDGGIHFNGIDQYGLVNKENTTQYFENPNFTIATWINVEENIVVDGNARIAGMDDPYGINLKAADNNGRVKVYVWDGSSWTGDYITNESFSNGTWRHFAITHDTVVGSRSFIDGLPAGSVNNPDIAFVQNSFFAIAASVDPNDSTSTKWHADAGYKDFRYYSRVLSDKEIAVLAGRVETPEEVPGLVVKYDFDEFTPADGEIITDVSGNKNNGVISGLYINQVDGINEKAIEFNPDALDLTDSADPNDHCVVLPENKVFASQSLTISSWINVSNDTLVFDAQYGEWAAIFGHDIGGAADYGLFYEPYAGRIIFGSAGIEGGWFDVASDANTIAVGKWYHVAATINAADSMLYLYVNGVEVASKKLSALLPADAVAGTTCIGGFTGKNKVFFGAMDDFMFFDTALDSMEIVELAKRQFELKLAVSTEIIVDRFGNESDFPLGTLVAEPDSETGMYDGGTEITLTAAPIDGYEFAGWEGDVPGTDNPMIISLDSNMYAKALFTPSLFDVEIKLSGNGNVFPGSGKYKGVSSFTATPAEGWKFSHWTGDIGSADSTINMLFVDIQADASITAVFDSIPTGIGQLNNRFNLTNYPNPFSNNTTISYTLNKQSKVTLSVYDMYGKTVEILVSNQEQQIGEHLVEFNASDLPAGIYLYKLQNGSNSVVKRMILNK